MRGSVAPPRELDRPAERAQRAEETASDSGVVPVAAICDVHGNLPALTAVLDEVDALGVDAIVVGGDVASGPMPVETLDALRARDALFVRHRRHARGQRRQRRLPERR
jgi:nucleotide-binding universal stress UspA family protein